MTSMRPQCFVCRHFDDEHARKTKGEYGCRAFREIPREVLYNDHDHRKPYPGDNGIRFELIEKQAGHATQQGFADSVVIAMNRLGVTAP